MCGKSLLCLTEMDNKKKRERWRYVLERRRVIREYMVVNEKNTDGDVHVQGAEVVKAVRSVGVTEGC